MWQEVRLGNVMEEETSQLSDFFRLGILFGIICRLPLVILKPETNSEYLGRLFVFRYAENKVSICNAAGRFGISESYCHATIAKAMD